MTANVQNLSIFRMLIGLASLVIVIIGIQAFASILNPVLLALFLAIILAPVFNWLLQKRVPAGVALLIMILGVVIIGAGLIALLVLSFNQLAASMSDYQEDLAAQLAGLQSWLESQGIVLSDIQLRDLVDTSTLASWLAGFLGGLSSLVFILLLVLLTIIFALLEASDFKTKLQEGLGADNPMLARFSQFTQSMVRYIALRAMVNLITGGAVTIMLWLLGIDFALLWGVLTFFLSFVPYLGIFLATVPSVLLAFIDGGIGLAVVVIIGVTIINFTAENAVAPKMMGHGLSLSPLVVFLSFFLWSWMLGAPGMFLSMPLTVMVYFFLDSDDSTRWLAILMAAPKPPHVAVGKVSAKSQ